MGRVGESSERERERETKLERVCVFAARKRKERVAHSLSLFAFNNR